MSEPDVEAVLQASAAKRRPGRPPKAATPPAVEQATASVVSEAAVRPTAPETTSVQIQRVSLQGKAEPLPVADDDPQILNLMRTGLTAEQARKLVHDMSRMW